MANEFNVYSGTDGVWTTAGNWTQGAPAASDNLIITSATTTTIVGGNYDADLLASLTVESGHAAQIGTVAIPLEVQATVVNLLGTGVTHITGTLVTLNFANGYNAHIGYDGVGSAAATLTNVNVVSGQLRVVNSAITAVKVGGGTLVYGDPGRGTTAITTLTLRPGGKVYYNSSATITTLALYGGIFDLSADTRAFTCTNVNVYGNVTVIDPHKRLNTVAFAYTSGGTISFST